MRADARKESFEIVEADGRKMLFTNLRLDRDTIPEGLFCYDVREKDESCGVAASIEKFVLINHWGTVISKEELPLGEDGAFYLENDLDYLCYSVKLEEFMEMDIEEILAEELFSEQGEGMEMRQ